MSDTVRSRLAAMHKRLQNREAFESALDGLTIANATISKQSLRLEFTDGLALVTGNYSSTGLPQLIEIEPVITNRVLHELS